ncbi:metal-dependent hydrolase [Dissulfurispira thermophila]|uniref:Metal-dependent hydrolase n=2 Tax=root TaxID=1 RepID=A0A7G1H057_9BACT|nr:MBL fold metallo-hydrolase [Dissulfurispira thermophila]BCB95511.1 metal-dependent hydrolase [Dissulfurispira thermophila]
MKKLFYGILIAVNCIFLIPATTFSEKKEVKVMVKNIHYLGHDTFKITGEKVIFTDPFKIKKKDSADIILITHEHYDHCSPEDVKKIQGPNTVIVTTGDCAKKISGNIKIVRPGDKINVSGIEIEAVPAYNTNKQFHTKDKGWVGYIFTANGQRIYIAGDTDYIPEMKTFKNIDIALLPVSGTYVMTAEEAVQAAITINPRIAIPMHYGSIVGDINDAKRFREGLKGKIEVVILNEE